MVMTALRSRCAHYIFVLFLLLSFFLVFSWPDLSGRRLDVYHTYFRTRCGLSANLECRSEIYCTRLAENTGRKKPDKDRQLRTTDANCLRNARILLSVCHVTRFSLLYYGRPMEYGRPLYFCPVASFFLLSIYFSFFLA